MYSPVYKPLQCAMLHHISEESNKYPILTKKNYENSKIIQLFRNRHQENNQTYSFLFPSFPNVPPSSPPNSVHTHTLPISRPFPSILSPVHAPPPSRSPPSSLPSSIHTHAPPVSRLPYCAPPYSIHSPIHTHLPSTIIVSVLSPFYYLLSCLLFVSLLLVIVSASSLLPPFVSSLVSLLVGHCVRLVPLLIPFVSLLVSLFCWSLRPSAFLSPFLWVIASACLPLPPLLSPSLLVIASSLCPPCLPLFAVLSPFLLGIVSVLSPFYFLLPPFLSPLLSPFLLVCVRLVFLLSFFCLLSPPFACNPSALQYYIYFPPLGYVSLAILYIVICLPLWIAMSAPILGCCVRLPCNPLYFFRSTRLLYPPLPCKP